ncbi:p-loop domain-containing protein [Desulfonema limicola]|uniref:P-loop domain-containing protein n=1 Tax=Desulfonema limicola TaxID=45656 RepID=A0A975GJ93_9BACT|nr:hypothetical protein [Desulfonema limicola]QTA82798.1 p-loop domain-containing protein [Desulfonema limicola]
MPAKDLNEVFNYFQIKPITLETFETFYVNADKGRGGNPIFNTLKRRIVNNPEGCLKLLVSGHKGSGKSTELIRLQKDIEKDFVVLNFSVFEELDIFNINYMELFIVTMEKLFNYVQGEEKINIDKKYLEDIQNWMKSGEIREINRNYMGLDLDTEMQAGADIPFLAKFFAKFKASAKSSSSMEKTLINSIEPKLSELISLCNKFIAEIRLNLPKVNKKGLVIIIEDMDKIDLLRGEKIFYDHSAQLKQLNCHCIFTFPIALLYNIKFKSVISNYNWDFVLPMIKVFEKSGSPCRQGIDTMKKIVEQRMEPALFEENSTVLEDMAKKSGGCLWDLFRMIISAADNALDYERRVIMRDDYISAYYSLKSEYERTIAENKEKGIKVDDYFNELASCAADESKKPRSSDIMLDLMNNQTVLNYNGENWHDVHPIVKDILKERGLLN